MFKDIRPDYGSTCTILTEHLRAVDVNISERTATAMLYAIKSDTLFFNRQANRVDLEAFSYLYPLADAALIRKMEGAEITLERLEYVVRATAAREDAGTGVLRVPRRAPARRLRPLRGRLLPAARGREVDDHLGRRQRRHSWCRCATWDTRGTRASSSASASGRSATPAGTGPWRRR